VRRQSLAATLELPPQATSVPLARRWMAEQLAAAGSEPLREPAGLLITEVVTNAVIHAGTPVRLSVRHTGTGVRVTVADGSAVPVVRRPLPGPGATTGRGSVLLDAIATRWGYTCVDGGKVTWFDLDLDLGAGEPPLPRQAAG